MMKRATRRFPSGALRDHDHDKLDFDGCLSPAVIERFAQYMAAHRHLRDGSIRRDDNWQKGMPLDSFRKSAWRHFFDFWRLSRTSGSPDQIERALCGVLFNIQGYLHEHLKSRGRTGSRK
jgi:hypothetical protein